METLAYLQLALAYDGSVTLDPITPKVKKFLAGFKWNALSSAGFIRFLGMALSVSLLSFAAQAIAYERGQQNSEIRSIQERLQELGYFNGPLTGYYGSITEDAVIRFQRDNGLSVTGTIDADTLAAMERLLRPTQAFGIVTPVGTDNRILRLNDRGLEVSVLQQQLQSLAYLQRQPTGVFDRETQNAVLNFQRDFGITLTGEVGSTTRSFLERQVARSVPTTQPFRPVTPTPTPTASGLKRGDRGIAVKTLQERLIVAGYPIGTADGTFGSLTEEALKLFQSSYGLVPNGVVGTETRQALDRKFYVVVIPKRNSFTLSAVREFFPDAFEAENRLGNYVHAGSSVRREVAEARTKYLRDRGLIDARVAYF